MNNPLDRFLNSLTMYRLLLYGLLVLVALGAYFSTQGDVFFSLSELVTSVVILLAVCYGTNRLLGYVYGVPTNAESAVISALILACILPPPTTTIGLVAIAAAGLIAMASKYVLAYRRKHIFNPVAIAAVLVGVLGLIQPDWWIGSTKFLPFTLVFALLIFRKVHRFQLAASFAVVSLAVLLWLGHADGITLSQTFSQAFYSSPLVFFAGVMLTEPLTAPVGTRWLVAYGALVGLLFASRWHIGSLYSAPELALVIGNAVAFFTARTGKPLLRLEKVERISPSMYDFVFSQSHPLAFEPGQYVEVTMDHGRPDNRGNRRTFSVASASNSSELRFGIKVAEPSSTFKASAIAAQPGTFAGVGAVGGEFTLPRTTDTKLAFLAGGIGVTPFRSMVESLQTKRDIIVLHAISSAEERIYEDIFAAAERYGVRTVPILGSSATVPKDWKGRAGRVTAELIAEEVPDYTDRLFYISGSPGFVDACRAALRSLGIKKRHIKTDYFPGY